MLVTMKEIVDRAHYGNYAVAAPNISTELDARAALDAGVVMNAPIILDISPAANPDLIFLGSYIRRLAQEYSIPVAINLDHGKTFDEIMIALRAGFTSVMIDCSTDAYTENVAKVKEVVKCAHALGVSVEAELGHVGQGNTYSEDRDTGLTNPEEALKYINDTGIDMLAIAIGTAHGEYVGTPYLDFDRLISIKEKTKFPLVLHGGSGTGDENLRKACTLGINKVNVNTDLSKSAYKQLMADGLTNKIWYTIQLGYRKRLMELIEIFGSNGKGGLDKNNATKIFEIDTTEK